MDSRRNNLDLASSPYLRQHADNPVWWQEWSKESFNRANNEGKIVFVSVGYSTCHWCHVMASEAFSDEECASLLNENFISIKVDREQRPDIDHYLMSFLVATTGRGGWPLNAFLTADGRPFFAMTYASVQPRFNLPPFAEILKRVVEFHRTRRDEVRPFDLSTDRSRLTESARGLLGTGENEHAETGHIESALPGEGALEVHAEGLQRSFDSGFGGFGDSQKFPPHATLLYMMHAYAATSDERFGAMSKSTLDSMMDGGLHDHLQGGFFRYCVDRRWEIPHFEKMLYDQAMMLWNFSTAAHLFGSQRYADVAASIVTCLEETFREGDLFISAYDADTDHKEGATYLWGRDEIRQVLTESEAQIFEAAYQVSEEGNFEGANHLRRRAASPDGDGAEHSGGSFASVESDTLRRAERKLLNVRRKRVQPGADRKLIAGWNALAGCGLLMAGRLAGISGAADRADEVASALLRDFAVNGVLAHSVLDGARQKDQFLSDVSALLLLLSMLDEDGGSRVDRSAWLVDSLTSFARNDVWFEADNDDFVAVAAEPYDQPIPSGIGMAELFLARREIRSHADYSPRPFRDPLSAGFQNLVALLTSGQVHVIESPEPLDWGVLPVNTIVVPGDRLTTCYRGVCYPGLPGTG